MASSLAVEWATKGVRVNALRCEAMRLCLEVNGYFRLRAETSSVRPQSRIYDYQTDTDDTIE